MNPSDVRKLGYKPVSEAFKRYEANPKHCLYCGTKIPYKKREGKFCNQSCSASYNNKGVTRHIKRSRLCSCGKPKKLVNKYCDDCGSQHIYHKTLTLDAAKSDRTRRNLLIKERGAQCEVCGITDWMGKPIKFELDHVDGNADNNSPENLRLICPNCHSQTETYKGANAGRESSRQIKRRKRYADGLTY